MWSFSRNPFLSSSASEQDSLGNIVNTDQTTGLSLIPPTVPCTMDARITTCIRKFSGYLLQDPERFILDFGAYCVFNRISKTDSQKVAAFQ